MKRIPILLASCALLMGVFGVTQAVAAPVAPAKPDANAHKLRPAHLSATDKLSLKVVTGTKAAQLNKIRTAALGRARTSSAALTYSGFYYYYSPFYYYQYYNYYYSGGYYWIDYYNYWYDCGSYYCNATHTYDMYRYVYYSGAWHYYYQYGSYTY